MSKRLPFFLRQARWLWLIMAVPVAVLAAPDQSVKPGINKEYTKTNLNVAQWVERFENEGREIFDQREKIVEITRVKPGMKVADVGAGSGLFTTLFAEAVGPKGTVYAVDIVGDFLKHIGARAKKAGLKNVKTVHCTDRSAKLPARSVDLVFLSDTYHHFEYPKNTMASIHQALRKGGELVVIDFIRIPGKSSDWVLNHVRAGKEEVIAEIEAVGFKKTEEHDFLKQNYILRFSKLEKAQ